MQVLNDVNSSEFSTLAQMLLKLKMYEKDVVMRQELADALVAQLPAEGFDVCLAYGFLASHFLLPFVSSFPHCVSG